MADTAKVFQLKGVMVTSARFSRNEKTSPLNLSIVGKEAMRSLNGTSVADVLGHMDGVAMKEYAGNSGIKTISQRGMGSEHTAVLLNGMRISVAQNALLDFGLYDIDAFDGVELVSGGSSSLYGADAVAGVVNIVTKSARESFSFKGNYGVGSFGQKKISSSLGFGNDNIGFRIGGIHEASEENYPFTVTLGSRSVSTVRKNSDYSSTTLYALSDGNFSTQLSYSFYSSLLLSERGVPGVFISPSLSTLSRQKDEDALAVGGISYAANDHVILTTQFLSRYYYEQYADPAIVVGNIPLSNYFKNNDVRLLSHLTVDDNQSRWVFGGEFGRLTATGSSIKRGAIRNNAGVFFSLEQTIPIHFGIVENVIVLPSARVDAVTKFPTLFSPSIAASCVFSQFTLDPLEDILVVGRIGISKNYSVPTFNELYYSGGGGIGNPEVRPEKGFSFDAGGNVSFNFFGSHSLTTKYFFIHLNDRIVWLPAGSFGVTPKNVRMVESEGVELNYKYTSDDYFGFDLKYSLISARKIAEDYYGDPNVGRYLIYVPSENVSVQMFVALPLKISSISSVEINSEFRRIGFRYTEEDNSKILPSVYLFNFNIRTALSMFDVQSFFKFSINNITNQQYQIMYSYPMPGRSFLLTAGIQI